MARPLPDLIDPWSGLAIWERYDARIADLLKPHDLQTAIEADWMNQDELSSWIHYLGSLIYEGKKVYHVDPVRELPDLIGVAVDAIPPESVAILQAARPVGLGNAESYYYALQWGGRIIPGTNWDKYFSPKMVAAFGKPSMSIRARIILG